MPRDVAVEGPRAGVVGVVLQDNVRRVGRGATLDQLGVAALRVGLVDDFTIPLSEPLSEHVEVVAVQMHGVGRYEFVVDYEAHGGVGAEVMDGPLFGVGEVAGDGERKDGVTSGGG